MDSNEKLKDETLKCFCILLQKFAHSEKHAIALGVLKQHKAISKNQSKKINGAIKDGNLVNAYSKMHEYLQKGKHEKISESVNDPAFPLELDEKNLVQYIFLCESIEWLHIIKNWDILTSHESELKQVAGNLLLPNTGWLKGILCLALNEVLCNEEEKPILNAIRSKLPLLPKEDSDEVSSDIHQAGVVASPEGDSVSDKSFSNRRHGGRFKRKNNKKNKKGPSEPSESQNEHSNNENDRPQSDIHDNPENGNDGEGEWTTVPGKRRKGDKMKKKGQAGNGDIEGEARRNNSSSVDDKSNIQRAKSDVKLSSTELWLEIDEGERMLEIRTIVSDKSPIPSGEPLCMIYAENGFKPVEMAFNQKKGFHFLRVTCDKGYKGPFIYKFCYRSDRERNGIKYEELPGYGFVNRTANTSSMTAPWMILLNVCHFTTSYALGYVSTESMSLFLPNPEHVCDPVNDENETSALTDIFCWVNCVRYGWTTDSRGYIRHHPLYKEECEKFLIEWLKNLISSVPESTYGVKVMVRVSLTIAVALGDFTIQRPELIHTLFKMLAITKLTEVECVELYKEMMIIHDHYKNSGLILPTFREALVSLYKYIPFKPNFLWLPTLPLFWLLVNGNVQREVTKVHTDHSLLYKRACLPSIQNFDWSTVWQSCLTYNAERKDLLDMIPHIMEISKVHPWIIRSFQFMLNSKELARLVKEKAEDGIATHFPLDSVLQKYLDSYYKRIFYGMDEELLAFDDYFKCHLDAAIACCSDLENDFEKRKFQLEVCFNILDIVHKYWSSTDRETSQWYLEFILQKTVLWIDQLQPSQDKRKEANATLRHFLHSVTIGIYKRKVTKKEVEFWDRLMTISWALQEFSEQWKKEIIQEIENSVNNHCRGDKAAEDFLEFYSGDLAGMSLHADVEKCLDDKAFKIAELILQKPGEKKIIEKLRRVAENFISNFLPGRTEQRRPRIICIFEKMYLKAHSNAQKKEFSDMTNALLFMCNWSFSAQFYELFGTNLLKLFTEDAQKTIKCVDENFRRVIGLFDKDQILVEHMHIIVPNKDRFLTVCSKLGSESDKKETASSSVDPHSKRVSDAVEICVKRLTEFKRTKQYVEDFIRICNYIDYDDENSPHAELQKKVDTKINGKRVADLVNADVGLSCIDYFGITIEQLLEFQQMSFIKDSKKLFRLMFENSVEEIRAEFLGRMQWTDLLRAWTDVKNEIFDLVKELDSGMLTMQEVTQRFEILHGIEDDIELEVNLLYDFFEHFKDKSDEVVLEYRDVRKKQIFNTFRLQHANRAIDVFLELRMMLNLQGDFNSIIKRKQMIEDQDEVHLYDVPEVLEILEISKIDDRKLDILEHFMNGEKVITWLQEKMKGIQEVQVLCDLAMISAGEDAIEVGRVSCLLSAVMGFAPLIFWDKQQQASDAAKYKENDATVKHENQKTEGEMETFSIKGLFETNDEVEDEEQDNAEDIGEQKQDESGDGLTGLLKRCKKVWEKAGDGKKLLQEWEETERQLSWFEDVEKFYGSVEKSSLTRTQLINEQGSYTITKLDVNKQLTLENSIKLEIPGKTVEDSAQILSLEALQDLQSKLMLIAGDAEKVQRDVNQFVNVLTSVQKLAEAYVQLESSGCMLFSGWEATIDCQGGSDLIIKINFTSQAPSMTGEGDYLYLDQVTQVLKDTLQKWQEHVSSKRMEFYQLNEFNISQIMYLCRELAVYDEIEEMPDQVRTLLSFVKPDFTDEDLEKSLSIARGEMHIKSSGGKFDFENASDGKSSDSSESETSDDENDESRTEEDKESDAAKLTKRKLKAVRTLIAQDRVPEKVAKAAVQAEGPGDITECVQWILLNDDEDMIDQLSGKFDEDCEGLVVEKHEAEVVQSVFQVDRDNTLNEVISRLQNKVDRMSEGALLDSVKTVCTGYLDETIMMNLQDHLSIGLLGSVLSNLCQPRNICRDLLVGLFAGRPNLLVCDENDIVSTVLSLFMKDDEQPLPSTSEVLICTEETSEDEVERLMRRAMTIQNDGDQLLHVLAFADKLNYATSCCIGKIFMKLKDSDRLNKNYQLVILLSKQQHYLATYFDQYLVEGKWIQPIEKIQNYLKKHLVAKDPAESAACITKKYYTVKVVSSKRSGVGKSLYVQRLREELETMDELQGRNVTLRLLENRLDLDYVIRKLRPAGTHHKNKDPVLVHVDMTPAVQHGIEAFTFNMFVLGSIQGTDGQVWKKQDSHLYVVEMTDFGANAKKRFSKCHILNMLPSVKCKAPKEFLERSQPVGNDEWLGMDRKEFESEIFQRPFQYLSRYAKGEDLDTFSYTQIEGDEEQCVRVLLRHYYIENPSWAQLRHFCSFLNFQLKNCEGSVFCNNPFIKQILTGLKAFAVRFMIKMAQDFATPSLKISDTSMKDAKSAPQQDQEFEAHQLRRKWEESFHPYVFFNEDGQTMTFVNVKIDRQGNLLGKNDEILEKIITPELTTALHQQGFQLRKNFDDYSRADKLRYLCQVLGIEDPFDPDPTYELTTDNVLKILAIYTRFQCGIPVIIMGETGCGKTRLVEFMSKLKAGKVIAPNEKPVENMTTLKIHGGITVQNIHDKVTEARNMEVVVNKTKNLTVLFCDEANTTEAIYAIKEVMCDRSIDGEFFHDSNLQIVAACNPYKKLSQEALKKLEDSGLGYRIRTSNTAHLFGNIPVRSLVYRVVALPPSMQPFVWDFGQLNDEAEKIYIQQMTKKLGQKLGLAPATVALIVNVLSHCQQYMRSRTDECRYVSLRDIERCMTTFEWFYQKRQVIHPLINGKVAEKCGKLRMQKPPVNEIVRTIIQTVGVCYHASLDDRSPFRDEIARCLNEPGIDNDVIQMELTCCQSVFLQDIRVGDNIACNQALRENVFMMAVCMDMRIPLFLVGKPGSSKSLAKTIITNNMQGQSSHSDLYQNLKQIHILSYQCSALTDADGINRVFSQCIQLQKKQNADSYTAVVVLDEIGLAEDSPNMPLKLTRAEIQIADSFQILHPLLERRSTDLTTVAHGDSERVGFVGISNWALDPAKMNRGIFLTRNKPEESDLRKTGRQIFEGRHSLWRNNEKLLQKLTSTYIQMYGKQEVEYFGLRDYYSLMKMICTKSKDRDERISLEEVAYAIFRNFGGGERQVILKFLEDVQETIQEDIPNPVLSIRGMIEDNLSEKESRFLLLLTNQFSIVSLLESFIKNQAQVVFGSSFPGDHNYTEICRNINKIKVCMETGKTVILLNMAKIHESLYDALNQHFVTFGGQNYVDLGLGGHRVKCRIANEFRLIVIEKKEVVKQEYPIPLINRLEKHHFSSESLLDDKQKQDAEELRRWMRSFNSPDSCFSIHHNFIGSHDDTASSVVLTTTGDDMDEYKNVLLQMCSMDAILRLQNSRHNEEEIDRLQDIYFEEQQHDSLANVLEKKMQERNPLTVLEVTSFSGALWEKDITTLAKFLQLDRKSIVLVSLEQFQTQEEYCHQLDQFFEKTRKVDETRKSQMVLLIQCSQAQSNGSLISCARHSLMNKISDFKTRQVTDGACDVIIGFLLSMEREGINESKFGSFALQHTHQTIILHVDELRLANETISPASRFFKKSLFEVFKAGREEMENNRGELTLLKMQELLIDSVAECITKVKDDDPQNDRYSRRIGILMELFTGNDDVSKNFQRIIIDKVVQAFSDTGEQFGEDNTAWVVEKASDGESLQEGGTFRKTLWLCLKKHMSQFLAAIVSIIDRRDNLDIIVKLNVPPLELNMWLEMFEHLDIEWGKVSKSSSFFISGRKNQHNRSCSVPFSFVVFDYLEDRWKALKSQRFENEDMFLRIFREFKMKTAVIKALECAKIKVMESFANDLVTRSYNQGTDDVTETRIVQKVLFNFWLKNFGKARQNEDFQIGDEVGILFCTFKELSTKLEKFSEILKGCPKILKSQEKWISEQEKRDDFILHILAFKDAVTLLKEMAESIGDHRKCIAWIDMARTVKELHDSVTSVINDEKLLKSINNNWMPLRLLDLLLLQLLPPAHIDSRLFRNFVRTIAQPAKLFWRGTHNRDPRSHNFLKIVLNVLKKCCNEIELQLMLNWCDSSPSCTVCNKKVVRPVVLQCRHILCEACVPRLLQNDAGERKCHSCRVVIPEDFNMAAEILDPRGCKILERMKLNCTSFFLEFLQQFCFKTHPNRPPMENQITQILDEIIFEDTELDRPQLDPTGLDLNINFKSCMLQNLLNYDKQLVERKLLNYIENAAEKDKEFMITVILKTLQRQVLTRTAKTSSNVGKLTEYWRNHLKNDWKHITADDRNLDMELLQEITEIRSTLCHFALLVDEKLKNTALDEAAMLKIDRFFDLCTEILTDNETPQNVKEFFIKFGCKKYGTQWLFQLAGHQELKVLIPPNLRQAAETFCTDYWALLGAEYIRTKSQLYQDQPEDYETSVAAIFDLAQDQFQLPYLLAVTSWSNNKDDAVKDNLREVLLHKCGNYANFIKFLSNKDLQDVIQRNATTKQQGSLLYQIAIMALAAVTTSQNEILAGFLQALNEPERVAGLFLPGMPEHRYFSTPPDFRVDDPAKNSMYTCPKGHLYTIGNCTLPTNKAFCPECKSTIGGTRYVSAAGNRKVDLKPATQAGYKTDTDDGTYSTGAERISLQGQAITQFILHACLLGASLDHQHEVARAVNQRAEGVQEFLVEQLYENLENLAKGLAKNVDDSASIIQRVLINIIQKGQTQHTDNWRTLESRKEWEQRFRQDYLLPVFQNMDGEITNAQQALKADEEFGAAPLRRLLSEIPDEQEDMDWDEEYDWQHPSFWRIIEHQDSAHLIQVLEDTADDSPGEVLQIILKANDLEHVKHLEDILAIQRKLTERYQYQLDLEEANQRTLRHHNVDSDGSDEKLIHHYISVWNEIYPKLKAVAPEFLSGYFKKLSLDSPLSMVLPSQRGRGQCAKLIAGYLIETQNKFLAACVEVIKPQQKIKEVDVQQLTSSDFVCIDKNKDLISLIDTHTSYRIHVDQNGRRHLINYNVEALEKQVREKFILCKKSIKINSLPLMKYPQDVGIGSDWREVASNIRQEPLTASLQQDIDRAVKNAYLPEICETVRTLTNAISFLAMVKTSPEKKLQEFLEKDLMLPAAKTSVIPRSDQITCEYILSLYQRLTWHKAVLFVRKGMDPYKEALCAIEPEVIQVDILDSTFEAFEQINIPMLQQRMNEILITGTATTHADWSLVEDVFPNIQTIDKNDDDSWYSELPVKLCNKHISQLFVKTVQYMDETA